MPWRAWRSLIVCLYSLLWYVLAPLIKALTLTPTKLGRGLAGQLQQRFNARTTALSLVSQRSVAKRAVHFFCSSAGEFEQAKPLIDRLQAQPDMFVHVTFFSKSGFDYANVRGERISYALSPLRDSVWDWGAIYSALRPEATIVVRHELWPALLETASQFGAVYLIDASQSLGERDSGLKRLVRGSLLDFFNKIFCVTDADRDFFVATYDLPPERLVVTGDTKYDRVVERAQLMATVPRSSTKRRLIAGSAHRADVDALITAWKSLGDAAAHWQVVMAPHHLDAANLGAIAALWQGAGTTPSRVTALDDAGDAPVVIVERMGMLAELYACGELAFVGGAMHHQVHNVLEPASHGLAIAFGPFYKNSQEAVRLADAGLATVCRSSGDLAQWWQRHDLSAAPREPMLAAVRSLAGGTERILAEVQPVSHA
jgi:3-deoxy-D-manno-octulosonic-acid transferase